MCRVSTMYQSKVKCFSSQPRHTAAILSVKCDATVLPCLGKEEMLIFLFVSVPLHIGGTILGRQCLIDPKSLCKANVEQPLIKPQKPWYLHPLAFIPVARLLSFLSPLFTTAVLFNTLWEYKPLCVYVFLLIICLLLILMVASLAY